MINRRRPSPAPPFPSPPLGSRWLLCGISTVGGQASQAGRVPGKSWRPWHSAIGAPSRAFSGLQEVTSLPLYREHVCVCFTLSPGRSRDLWRH